MENIIFLHIPKAAGSTFSKILDRNYSKESVYQIDGKRRDESINEFINAPLDVKKSIKCLRGHLHFGIHKHLPGKYKYITFLRHPISRISSLYWYIKRTPVHYLHDIVNFRNMSLREFVMSDITNETSNDQVRLISGSSRPQIQNSDYQIAKVNIDSSFGFVGFVEDFDKSLIMLKSLIGLRSILYRKKNVKIKNERLDLTLDQTILDTIHEKNYYDIKLYNFVRRNYEQSLQVSKGKESLFKFQNKLFNKKIDLKKKLNRVFV